MIQYYIFYLYYKHNINGFININKPAELLFLIYFDTDLLGILL